MWRRVGSILMVLSLMLCVGILGVWLRSYWHEDIAKVSMWEPMPGHPHKRLNRGGYSMHILQGGIWCCRQEDFAPTRQSPATLPRRWDFGSRRVSPTGHLPTSVRHSSNWWFGFAYGAETNPFIGTGDSLRVPLWLPVLLTLVLPLLKLRSCAIHRRRLIRGFCTVCGYDLRASSERCPECGTPIATGRREHA